MSEQSCDLCSFFTDLLLISGTYKTENDIIRIMIEQTRLDQKTVVEFLKELETQNFIKWMRGQGKDPNKYLIIRERDASKLAPIARELEIHTQTEKVIRECTAGAVIELEGAIKSAAAATSGAVDKSLQVVLEEIRRVNKGNAELAEALKELREQTLSKIQPNVAVLVDYDNVTASASQALIKFSFQRLREYVRTIGNVVLADVFLPVRSCNERVVARLSDAGFQVVVCPMAYKDKDAVDAKINWRARQYLSTLAIDIVIIVSRDRDFRDLDSFADDIHREVRFIDIVKDRELFEGEDPEIELVNSRETQEFVSVIRRLTDSNIRNLRDGQEERIAYLIDVVIQIAKLDARRWGFNGIKDAVQSKLSNRWNVMLTHNYLPCVLTAMIDEGMLIRHREDGIRYYTLNLENLVVKLIIESEK